MGTKTNKHTPRSIFYKPSTIISRKMAQASIPGENFEVRQTSATEDWHPDPSKSLPLDKARQALIDDIIALYSCEPTIERVKRYTPDCVYDDQFVYANDRYKMAGQWFALRSSSKLPRMKAMRSFAVTTKSSSSRTSSPGRSRSSLRLQLSPLSCLSHLTQKLS